MHIATGLNFFQEAKVEVEIRITGSSVQHLKLLEQGNLNVGHQAPDHIVRAIQRGSDLRIIMGMNRPALSLVVQRLIERLADLRSKRLGVDGIDTGFALLLKEMLRRNGLSENDYVLTPIGSSQKRFNALKSGEVDGTLLDPPYDLNAADLGYRSLARTLDYFPNLQGSVLAARQSWASQNHEFLIRFLRCYLRALDWLKRRENREAAAMSLASGLNVNVDLAMRV